MVRTFRKVLNITVPAVGMALVVGAVLLAEPLAVQLFLVVAGLMLTEAGVWRLANSILPDERRYGALRAEAEHFITLVRQLNTAAVALDDDRSRFAMHELETEMHRSIDRMVTFAGKADAQVQRSEAGSRGAVRS